MKVVAGYLRMAFKLWHYAAPLNTNYRSITVMIGPDGIITLSLKHLFIDWMK